MHDYLTRANGREGTLSLERSPSVQKYNYALTTLMRVNTR